MEYRKAILLSLLLLVGSVLGSAQTDLRGDWQGQLRLPMGTLRIILHLSQSTDGLWQGSLDSPDQGAYGLRVDEVRVQGDSLYLGSKLLQMSYSGVRDASGKIVGKLTQGGANLPLDLERQGGKPTAETPKAISLDYPSEELTIPVSGTEVKLSGMLSLPKVGKAPYPLVVLITGSGPQDRDETVLGHKPFVYIADTLLGAGYAVFRYDDRGVGRSTGVFNDSHVSDFVKDATAVVRTLRSDKRILKGKIYLVGHSEGAYVAAEAARQDGSIAGVVSLAGPAYSLDRVLGEQLDALAELSGMAEAKRADLRKVNQQVYDLVKSQSHTIEEARAEATKYLEAHKDLLGQGQEIRAIVSQLTPYLQELLRLDIPRVWQSLRCPVIGLYAGTDKQVLPTNATELQRLVPQARVRVFPGYNHLFLRSETGSPMEYARLPKGFSPEALSYLRQELDRLSKKR